MQGKLQRNVQRAADYTGRSLHGIKAELAALRAAEMELGRLACGGSQADELSPGEIMRLVSARAEGVKPAMPSVAKLQAGP